jgi:transposase
MRPPSRIKVVPASPNGNSRPFLGSLHTSSRPAARALSAGLFVKGKMSISRIWVGIDVSKGWFDAHCQGRDGRFSNDAAGIAGLLCWLGEGDFHVCLEPTGGHERALRKALAAAGIPVSVAHPAKVAAFARAMGRVHKTDGIDARLLAQYGRLSSPEPSILADESRRELRRLVLTWKSLQGQLLAVRAQLGSPEVAESASRGLSAAESGLDTAMLDVVAAIEGLLKAHPELGAQVALLESVKGIGRTSALQILAHLPEGELRSARELASYAGTVPCQRESGSSVRGRSRVSPRCNRRLRTVLYMCALVARRFCPHLKAFADRLAERGKAKKQVIVAVMRKLAHAIFAVLSTRMPYNGALLCPGA